MSNEDSDATLQPAAGENTIAASLFQNGTAQVGGMVTSITLVGQAFANLNIHSAAAPLAAFVFATLLAIYQVSMIQKAPRRSCFILVPIATLILFALSYAGNNSLAPAPDTAALEQELALTKTELQLQQQQLASSNALIAQFQQALDLHTNADHHTQLTPAYGPAQMFLDTLVPPAMAQDTPAPGSRSQQQQRQALAKALADYQRQQEKLRQEQQQLDQRRLEIQKQQPQSSGWRQWR